jgi:hypothetical protein
MGGRRDFGLRRSLICAWKSPERLENRRRGAGGRGLCSLFIPGTIHVSHGSTWTSLNSTSRMSGFGQNFSISDKK